jgi:hypothetical protein
MRQCVTLVSVAVALKSYQQPFGVILEPGARTQGSQALDMVGFSFTSGVGTFRKCRDVRLESVMRSTADIGRCMLHAGDRDLGASVAALMHEVCERLPVEVAHAALARHGLF